MTAHLHPIHLHDLRGSGRQALERARRRAERLFDDWRQEWLGGLEDTLPRVNLVQTGDVLELTVELPGMSRDHVELTIDEDVLTIYGEKPFAAEEGCNYHILERSSGVFARAIRLPRSVDLGRVVATMADGVLTVTLPKSETADARIVPIRIGEPKHDATD